jgi:membrane protein
VLRRTVEAAGENRLPFLASALTFDTLLAAVPFLLLLLAVFAMVLQSGAGGGEIDLARVFGSLLPPRTGGPRDPLAAAEQLLGRVAAIGRQITLVAVPTFVWLATRAFASVRIALNEIFDVAVRPPRPQGLVIAFLRVKLRDLAMVLGTVLLFLASTVIGGGVALARARGDALDPGWSFVVSRFWHLAAQGIAYGFIVALFFLLYRFGSQRRLRASAALLAALFAATAFEGARRLYALYLTNVAAWGTAAADASIGALILFVLWMYYSAVVFLLGGVVAQIWELRRLQRIQRARLDG